MDRSRVVKRWAIYVAGLVLLAAGLTLNTKAGLGVAAIISVPYAISEIWHLNFGDMLFIVYALFVVIQMLLHIRIWKKNSEDNKVFSLRATLIKDALQLPLSVVFTRFLNLLSDFIPDFSTGMEEVFLGTLAGRILVLIFAICITGVGAAMSLDMRLVPNPGDGIVQAISDTWGKSVGFTKNCIDLVSICISITLGLVFAGQLVGIGIGTVLAVIGTGRAIALFHHFFLERLKSIVTPVVSV